jgi:hypothetical protein
MKATKHRPKFLSVYGFPLDVADRKTLSSYKATFKRKLRAFKKVFNF